MGFFDPDSGNNNGTPASQPALSSKMQLRDANGNIITSVPLNGGRGQYTRTLTDKNIGQNSLGAYFPGDGQFAGSGTDAFNSHVADANGRNATKGIFNGVTQIVAGPGIYISAPNGQGVVTISTAPIDPNLITEDLYDVQWNKNIYATPSSDQYPGEFVAVGAGGVTARSRDGHNWVKLSYPTPISVQRFDGVDIIRGNQLNYNQVEYSAYGTTSTGGQSYVFVGWAGGPNNEGMSDYYAMINQSNTPLSGISVIYAYPTQSDLEYIHVGTNGLIGHGQIVFDSVNHIGQLWVERTQANQECNQATANNSDTSNTFKVVVPYSNTSAPGGGIVMSNRNGHTTSSWTTVYTNASSGLYGSAYGDGVWIACGSDNTVMTSADATNWTKSSGAVPGATWWYAAYGNGRFVCVGYTMLNGQQVAALQYSTDGGVTWIKGSPGTTNRLYGITYSPELNVFVACGVGGALVSVDG